MELLTVLEVSKILRVDRRTINSMINRGELRAYKVGKLYRITKEDLERYLEKSRT